MELLAAPRAVARFSFDIALALQPRDAIEMFTPEGERAWATGWDPVYANISDPQSIGSGTIFTTGAHGVRRAWIVDKYEIEACAVAYTVFTVEHLTRIEVKVHASGDGAMACVSYERTSLSAAADADVERFARDADAMRAEWQSAIDVACRK